MSVRPFAPAVACPFALAALAVADAAETSVDYSPVLEGAKFDIKYLSSFPVPSAGERKAMDTRTSDLGSA